MNLQKIKSWFTVSKTGENIAKQGHQDTRSFCLNPGLHRSNWDGLNIFFSK